MTREQAKEWLPIIQAFAEGKEIQSSPDGANWFNSGSPTFSPTNYYRVKPEPREFYIAVYKDDIIRGCTGDNSDAVVKDKWPSANEFIKVREVI